MEIAIDRRQRRDLFWFMLAEPDFFESPTTSRQAPPEFSEIVRSLTPPEWLVDVKDIWLYALPPDTLLPLQGFKIHISGTSVTAIELLRRVIPVCVEHQAGFKLMADSGLLELTTSKNYSRGASGKFITIYPSDNEHFTRLVAALDQATNGLDGPYILSDKRYEDNKVLYYRYGGFAPRFTLNIYGEKVPVINSSAGELVPDVRTPFFDLPEGVADPFGSVNEAQQDEILLNNRYRITDVIVYSNAGGVYKALDEQSGQTVIIKEARPQVNVTRRNNRDAIATLRKEAHVLERLGATGYTPKLIDFFQEWEHCFLVEEFVEGTHLSAYRARKDVVLLLKRDRSEDDIKRFCSRLYRITAGLIGALQAFHAHGVVMGDLSPYNILIDPETLAIKVIDFEGARLLDESATELVLYTPGFVSPERWNGGVLSPNDDFYSLGSVIYSFILPVQEFFQLSPSARDLFIEEISRDFRLPHSIKELIFALLSGEVKQAQSIVEATDLQFPEAFAPVHTAAERRLEVCDVIDGITEYILNKTDAGREDRLWPSDYRLFSTNPLSVAFGAVGTAMFLKASLGRLPDNIHQWLDRQQLSLEGYPPGLFSGLSGIGLGLNELGLAHKGSAAIDLALESPLLFEGPDLFFGAAGAGLSSLYFFTTNQDERYLAKAREIGDFLVAGAGADEHGNFWPNVDGVNYFGHCHGGSGIALFLLQLFLATGDERYLSVARSGVEYEIAHGRIDDESAAWDRAKGDSLDVPYWRFGTAGVGSVLIRFASVLGDRRYQILAEKAASQATTKYAVFPGQLMGLSGIGEFLLDMYRITGEQRYLNDAFKVAEGILLFQIKRPEGIAFPGEELLRICTDFGTGSAGVGLFLMRLLKPGPRLFYEFEGSTSLGRGIGPANV